MTKNYKDINKTMIFTGNGWMKQLIEFILSIHVEEWYLWCQIITEPKKSSSTIILSTSKDILLFEERNSNGIETAEIWSFWIKVYQISSKYSKKMNTKHQMLFKTKNTYQPDSRKTIESYTKEKEGNNNTNQIKII